MSQRSFSALQQLPGWCCDTKPELRKQLDVQVGAEGLSRYFGASVELMQVLARACGHASLSDLNERDITTWKREMADLSGVCFAGVKR